MTREQLESEISRLALEESQITEIQKRLKRKSSAWTALEIKRIECSSYLAIYSVQLADMMTGTQRHTKLYGIKYSSNTNPQVLIRAGLRKAGIHRTEQPTPSPPPVSKTKASKQSKKKEGDNLFRWALLIGILAVLFILIMHKTLDDDRDSTTKSRKVNSTTVDSTSLSSKPDMELASERLKWLDYVQSMVSDPKAKLEIRESVLRRDLPYKKTPQFAEALKDIQRRYPHWDEIRQVRRAILIIR